MKFEDINLREEFSTLENVLDSDQFEQFYGLESNIKKGKYSIQDVEEITDRLSNLETTYNSLLSEIKLDLESNLIEGVIQDDKYYPSADYIMSDGSFFRMKSDYEMNTRNKFHKEEGRDKEPNRLMALPFLPGYLGFMGGALVGEAVQNTLLKTKILKERSTNYESFPGSLFYMNIPLMGAITTTLGTAVALGTINPLLGVAYFGSVPLSYYMMERPGMKARKRFEKDPTNNRLNQITKDFYLPFNELMEEYSINND